ncbi:hypothetical protein DL93DRAFT_2057788 [Clavulina sp. PMI_390]|nr:hypothetical protein DL93DRAFT_2057788 [Clavulina sp. PMI_390]
MALREKQVPGSRVFAGGEPFLNRSRRGAVYLAILFFCVWLFLGSSSSSVSSTSTRITSKLKNQALRLTSPITDEEIYGPPVLPPQPRPLPPKDSAIAPLRSWEHGVPETTVHGISGGEYSVDGVAPLSHLSFILHAGWSLLENVVLLNGTLFIVSDDTSKFPPLDKMFSTGVPMESEPSTWRGRDTTPREMQIVSTKRASELFGPYGSRIQGTTFFCNDASQFASHYYHFVGEILFGLWRTYSSLDLNIPASGKLQSGTPLTAPRRFMFPHVNAADFRDYSGLSEFIMRAVFPSMAFEFRDTFNDRNMTGKPFILDRVVIGDRIAAELSPQWHRLYKYVAPAFELPGSGTNFWGPVRRALVQFLAKDELLSDSTTPESISARSKTVITYVSRQDWGRRTLLPADHDNLVKALRSLERRHGYEVNIVSMDKLTLQEQLNLALRTTVMLGVHGNGLTHALWMDPSRSPVLMEFFADQGFSFDYEYPMRQLGITYYGWWNSKSFSHRELPENHIDDAFQGTAIRIDGEAVAKRIHEHVTSTAQSSS